MLNEKFGATFSSTGKTTSCKAYKKHHGICFSKIKVVDEQNGAEKEADDNVDGISAFSFAVLVFSASLRRRASRILYL